VADRRQQAALMRDMLCHAPDVIIVADIATAEVRLRLVALQVSAVPFACMRTQACTALAVASGLNPSQLLIAASAGML
jgi:hypothetical protein